nr:uncharacterized protein LOC109190937 [Ipomoea batatas]
MNRSHVKMHCTKCKKEGHNKRKCHEDPAVRERLANPKKRVRVKAKKGQVPTSSSTTPSATAPSSSVPPSTLTLQAETQGEDDDSWLANIDIDAVVSQLIGTPTPSTEVTADEIPMPSQPPILEDTQQEAVGQEERKSWTAH